MALRVRPYIHRLLLGATLLWVSQTPALATGNKGPSAKGTEAHGPMGKAESRALLRRLSRKPPKLVILDYDGTLARFAEPISEKTAATLSDLLKQGTHVAIVTDR